jgi:hypothetical protein
MSRPFLEQLSRAALLIAVSIGATACSQTTRLSEETSTGDLAKSKKAVAVMRLGAASQTCQHVGVWLGTREGNGFRPVKPVAIINHRSLNEVPVAEVELHPGEYHVISYACGTGTGVKQIADTGGGGLVRTSYASFTLGPGEIVNVGSFEFHAARTGTNAFGRPFKTTVTIADWPLAEIDRYKEKRPQIFAQMKTRLMTPTPRGSEPGDDDCQRLAALKADGKIQNLPASCTVATAAAKQP